MLRHLVYRVGRKLYAWGRGESPNDPAINGEYWLIDQVAPHLKAGSVILDIGANKGAWTTRMLTAAKKPLLTFAFEPSGVTRELLAANVKQWDGVQIIDTALSNAAGSATFYASAPGAGTNSLHPISGACTEPVRTTTLDAFLAERGISHVAFAKIDVEGYDALVLQGAKETLQAGAIDLVQFEYNWRWLLNSMSLRSVFSLIESKPYRLGKLIGCQLIFFEQWHFELDRFFENNYVLVRKGSDFDQLGVPATFDKFNVPSW